MGVSIRKKKTQKRGSCTYCGAKYYLKNLVEINYSLLRRKAFHCQKCMSLFADNLHTFPLAKSAYLLELFAGSRTISDTAEEMDFKAFSIDNDPKLCNDLTTDILDLSIKQIPESNQILILWASVPCTVYSVLSCSKHWKRLRIAHRKYYYIPATPQAIQAVKLLEKTFFLIRSLNPTYYFIENPRGVLRHMPQLKAVPFRTSISYADFGADVYKPTDIFHNCPFLSLPGLLTSVGRQFPVSVAKMSNAFERSIVPAELIRSILSQIKSHHNLL